MSWGTLANLTPDQQQSLDALRDFLRQKKIEHPSLEDDPMLSPLTSPEVDAMLLRFLRARKFEVEATTLMLDNCIKWRMENNVARELHDPGNVKDVVLGDSGACLYFGDSGFYDKAGRPVIIGGMQYLDGELMKEAPHLKAGCLVLEQAAVKIKPEDEGACYILDFAKEQKSGSDNGMDILKKAVQLAGDYYPEILHRCYFVHSGWTFFCVWKIVSLWMDKRSRAKFVFVSNNEGLLEYFDADQLPAELGGTGQPLGAWYIMGVIARYEDDMEERLVARELVQGIDPPAPVATTLHRHLLKSCRKRRNAGCNNCRARVHVPLHCVSGCNFDLCAACAEDTIDYDGPQTTSLHEHRVKLVEKNVPVPCSICAVPTLAIYYCMEGCHLFACLECFPPSSFGDREAFDDPPPPYSVGRGAQEGSDVDSPSSKEGASSMEGDKLGVTQEAPRDGLFTFTNTRLCDHDSSSEGFVSAEEASDSLIAAARSPSPKKRRRRRHPPSPSPSPSKRKQSNESKRKRSTVRTPSPKGKRRRRLRPPAADSSC